MQFGGNSYGELPRHAPAPQTQRAGVVAVATTSVLCTTSHYRTTPNHCPFRSLKFIIKTPLRAFKIHPEGFDSRLETLFRGRLLYCSAIPRTFHSTAREGEDGQDTVIGIQERGDGGLRFRYFFPGGSIKLAIRSPCSRSTPS